MSGTEVDEGDRGALGRLSTTTVDQAVSGASNVLAGVLAARLLGGADFGYFGIVFLSYGLILGVSRSLICQPILVDPAQADERTGETLGTTLGLGAVLGLVVAVAGAVTALSVPRLGVALVVMAVLLPGMLVQDVGRFLAFARRTPYLALHLDLVWLVLMPVAASITLVPSLRSLPVLVGAWAASGAVAGLLTWHQHRDSPLGVGLAWLRRTWAFGWRYSVSFTGSQGLVLAASGALSAISGPQALGALRGANLLLTPFSTIVSAGAASSVSDIARTSDRSLVRRRALLVSGSIAVIGLANGLVLLLLPDALGRLVLGSTWDLVPPLAFVATVDAVLIGLTVGPGAALHGLRAIDALFVLTLLTGVVTLALSIVGALLGGVVGCYWGVALSHAVQAVLWWGLFLSGRFRTRAIAPAEAAPPATAASPATGDLA